MTFTEDILFDINKAITLRDWYDYNFTALNGKTIINGNGDHQ